MTHAAGDNPDIEKMLDGIYYYHSDKLELLGEDWRDVLRPWLQNVWDDGYDAGIKEAEQEGRPQI